MKITLAMVVSADGKSTRGDDPHIYTWTSEEDRLHFASLIEESNLIIMGSKTYQAAKSIINHKSGRLRIVITRKPEEYEEESIPGQLEFSNEKAEELVMRLERAGYKRALLAGGEGANALFFKAGLVNELILTVEPKILGHGKGLVDYPDLNLDLKLESIEKLNEKGTLLLKYKIL